MNTNETVLEEAGAPRANNEASALSVQVGGAHYRCGGIQPVQYIEANELGFLEGCIVKRVTRHNRDGGKGRQDIEKAIHELQLLLELRYGPEVDVTQPIARVAVPLNGWQPPVAETDPTASVTPIADAVRAFFDVEDLEQRCARHNMLIAFFNSYGRYGIRSKDRAAFLSALAEADIHAKRGCTNIRMHYDLAFAPENNGIFLSWDEPKTDSPNAETDFENPKCQATEVKCGANFSGIENFGGLPSEAAAGEATEFKEGEPALIDGVVHRVHKIEDGRAVVSTKHWAPYTVDADCLRPVRPTKTDPTIAELPSDEPESEATADADAPSRETSTMRVSMPCVIPVTLRERYLGKHPALGAAYRKATGATSQDLFGSLIRGAEYMHSKHGRCIFIGNHPHDGALVIMEAYDEDVDEHYMFGCEHRELSAVVPQTDSATPERLVDEPKSEATANVVKFAKDLAATIPPGALGQPYQRIAEDLKNVKFQPFYPRQRAGTTRIEFVDRAAFEALLPALRPGDRVRFDDNGYARSSLRSGKTGTIIEQLTPGVFLVRPDDEPKDSQGWMFEEGDLVFVARGEG